MLKKIAIWLNTFDTPSAATIAATGMSQSASHTAETRSDRATVVDVGINRTEGGMHIGRGAADDSCDVGVPSGVNIANRRFVVDATIGAVVAFCTFGAGNAAGGSGAPDSHLFRVENGKLRFVHTLTHLLQANFRGGGGTPPNNPQ